MPRIVHNRPDDTVITRQPPTIGIVRVVAVARSLRREAVGFRGVVRAV
jgi:hypothetical protein